MSRRSERLGNLIRTILAEAIRDHLSDPRIPLVTSITRVEVSEDLEVARVHVSVMADEPKRKLCLTTLQNAAGRLRRLLAPELRLRRLPSLVFRLDDSVRHGIETLAVIDHAMRELGEVPVWEREERDADVITAETGDDTTGSYEATDRTAQPQDDAPVPRDCLTPEKDT